MEIYIDKECWDKIINYAKAAYQTEKCEIGGMSVVTQDKDGDWLIQEPVILKQEIGSTTCDLDKEELAKYYTQMAIKYNKMNFRFCWWHSHHTMSAFWSGTDISSIEEYGEGESDLSFALVVNLKEEYKCRVSVWKPVEIHQDVELNILSNTPDVKIPLDILTEVEAKCETRNIVSNYNSKTKQLSLANTHIDTKNRYNWSNYSYLNDNLADIDSLALSAQEEANFESKYEYAVMKTSEFIRQVTIGDWSMHKFKKAIRETNKQLGLHGIQILELTKAELDEFIEMNHEPHEIVETEAKYADIVESITEMWSYNTGYGGYTV